MKFLGVEVCFPFGVNHEVISGFEETSAFNEGEGDKKAVGFDCEGGCFNGSVQIVHPLKSVEDKDDIECFFFVEVGFEVAFFEGQFIVGKMFCLFQILIGDIEADNVADFNFVVFKSFQEFEGVFSPSAAEICDGEGSFEIVIQLGDHFYGFGQKFEGFMFLDDIVMAVGVVEGLFFCFEAV